jgi:hypothetical protein
MVPEIANIIREFLAFTYDPIDEKEFESFTLLGHMSLVEKEAYYKISDNVVYANFENFCVKCVELDKAIHKWLKGIGIDNFNKKDIIY